MERLCTWLRLWFWTKPRLWFCGLWTRICVFCRNVRRLSSKLKVHTIVTAETYGAHEEILQRMKKKVELIPAEPADCEMVLIFCVVISRVGSDVEEAMMRIPETEREKPVVLVVMHHTREENHQTDGTQWRTIYENVKFQAEILFHQTTNGLLECDRNDQAIQKLGDELFCRNVRRLSSKLKVHTIVTAETYGAHEEILQRMKNKVELIPAEPVDCEVVLIFCVVISRVGSDVEEAIMRIPETAREKPVVLVVMHHTTEENYQTDGTQWRTRYENAKFHVDVLFHQTKHGLLKCDKNNLAIQKLVDKCENREFDFNGKHF